jgi:hypothetical protein
MTPPSNTHTVDEALNQFELIAGSGSETDRKACAMTLLAWIAGQEWTDHPVCAHPQIADWVIAANDTKTATPETRAELVRAGQEGVLDTWWVPGPVLAWALTLTSKDEEITQHARTLRALGRIAAWKITKERPVLRYAVLSYADLRYADLRSAVLRYAVLSYADLRSAVLSSADLSYADLRSADLSSADLRYADLRYADLRSAVLSSADLRYAEFSGARGLPASGMPDGWKLGDSGLWVRAS